MKIEENDKMILDDDYEEGRRKGLRMVQEWKKRGIKVCTAEYKWYYW